MLPSFSLSLNLPCSLCNKCHLDDIVMAGYLEAKVSGHATVAGVNGKVETQGVQVVHCDQTVPCV